jgi:hypothetical protein
MRSNTGCEATLDSEITWILRTICAYRRHQVAIYESVDFGRSTFFGQRVDKQYMVTD